MASIYGRVSKVHHGEMCKMRLSCSCSADMLDGDRMREGLCEKGMHSCVYDGDGREGVIHCCEPNGSEWAVVVKIVKVIKASCASQAALSSCLDEELVDMSRSKSGNEKYPPGQKSATVSLTLWDSESHIAKGQSRDD